MFASAPADAQTFPNRPIRFLVSFAPGAFTDQIARTLGERFTAAWGQPVVVENRPGAGGVVAAEMLVRAPADGHTIQLMSTGLAVNATLQSRLPFDPLRDLAPVSFVGESPNILAVHPSLPVRTLQELIALARKRPGQLTFATAGVGTSQHLAGELLKMMAKIDLVHVPYKGGPPAVADLVAGHVDMIFGATATVAMSRAKRVRPLAVTSAQRSPALPEVATAAEQGLPGYEAVAWYGVMAPAGTTKEVIARLNAEMRRALDDTELRARMLEQTVVLRASTPEEFGTFFAHEIRRWAPVIRAAAMKPE